MITDLQYTNPNRTGSLLGVVAGQTQARDTHLPTVNHYFELLTASGSFVGNWHPTAGDSDTEVIITGGSIYDGTTLSTVAEQTISVHATSLNYIYLECDLTVTTVDSYVSGGTAAPASTPIASATTFPTNTNEKGYILLCTWQRGAVVHRYAYFPFACELLQKRSGSIGDVTFNWWSY
jgi:hypothetical protein